MAAAVRQSADSHLRHDADLDALAAELRWREWMDQVEAVIFASKEPVSREVLARVVGPGCKLDLVIEDIRAELRGRPYDLVAVAGGWHLRTRKQFADAIHLAMGGPRVAQILEQFDHRDRCRSLVR
jgi:segregation and condensation protein B